MTIKNNMKMSGIANISLIKKLKNFREGTMVLIIIVISILLWILSPSFLTVSNLRAVAVGFSINAMVVVGMALVMISGGIDLSVGSVLALSTITVAKLYANGTPLILAILAAIAVCALCGLFNAFFIGKYNMPPFIVTLALMSVARGLCYIITRGRSIALTGQLPAGFKELGSGNILGMPILVIIVVVFVVIADILFRKSALLRLVFYTGSNQKAAQFSGINVTKVKFGVYIASSILCGLGGILMFSRFSYASATAGNGMELTMIAGAIIGGVTFEGGEGTVLGSVLGIILLALITNGLVLVNISVYWQKFIAGIILILAVWFDYYRSKTSKEKLT